MENTNRTGAANPQEKSPAPENPGSDQEQQGAQEGGYRNVETSVGKASDFDDDYEVEQEDEMSNQEARSEEEGRTDEK